MIGSAHGRSPELEILNWNVAVLIHEGQNVRITLYNAKGLALQDSVPTIRSNGVND